MRLSTMATGTGSMSSILNSTLSIRVKKIKLKREFLNSTISNDKRPKRESVNLKGSDTIKSPKERYRSKHIKETIKSPEESIKSPARAKETIKSPDSSKESIKSPVSVIKTYKIKSPKGSIPKFSKRMKQSLLSNDSDDLRLSLANWKEKNAAKSVKNIQPKNHLSFEETLLLPSNKPVRKIKRINRKQSRKNDVTNETDEPPAKKIRKESVPTEMPPPAAQLFSFSYEKEMEKVEMGKNGSSNSLDVSIGYGGDTPIGYSGDTPNDTPIGYAGDTVSDASTSSNKIVDEDDIISLFPEDFEDLEDHTPSKSSLDEMHVQNWVRKQQDFQSTSTRKTFRRLSNVQEQRALESELVN